MTFIQRGSGWRQASGLGSVLDTSSTIRPQTEKLREALCTVGNGSAPPAVPRAEWKAGQVHYPGASAAGVYNRLIDDVSGTEIDNESLVDLPTGSR